MKPVLQKSLEITISILLGAILTGFGCGVCWYFISYNYSESSNNGIINYSREGGAAIWTVFGILLGIVSGGISGSIISMCGLNKSIAALTGFIVNGSFSFIIFFGLSGGNFIDAPKYFWLSLLGQSVVGAIAGFLVSLFHKNSFKSGDL